MSRIIYLLLAVLFISCEGNPNRQEIDLSDRVIENPDDGVGHYVYALALPKTTTPGEDFEVQMEWRTVGGVDPNARYTMDLVLTGPDRKEYEFPAGANTVGELHLANWLSYRLDVPAGFEPGNYALGVRIRDANKNFQRVEMGFVDELKIEEGFYELAHLEVTEP